MTRPEIIFFGNGPLADYAKDTLSANCDIIFHARTRDDLTRIAKIKAMHPDAYGVLASFGVIIKKDILDLFEPTGILNIHPSLLPDLRGASPIETAILRGDTKLSVSIMKLAEAMDAGPVYHQATIDFSSLLNPRTEAPFALRDFLEIQCGILALVSSSTDAADLKDSIYQELAQTGAKWLANHLGSLPTPTEQKGTPTFCTKLDKTMSKLNPSAKTAEELHREIIALAHWPRSKFTFRGQDILVLASHVVKNHQDAIIPLNCKNDTILSLDILQPAGKRPMDAKSFKNGYIK